MVARAEAFGLRGQAGWALTLPNGDRALVSVHGAQVLSWVAGGRERLYLSSRSVWDGQAAIRGGMPVCFPQFNQRGTLPKHGFARNLPWLPQVPVLSEHTAELTLLLRGGEATQRWWPQAFEARLTARLSPGCLQVTLDVVNAGTGDKAPALTFTGALHTYLAVSDIGQVRLRGLHGQPEWNALTNERGQAEQVLAFGGEFDRVYAAPAQPLHLSGSGVAPLAMADLVQTDTAAPEMAHALGMRAGLGANTASQLTLEQGGGFDQCVVWNPGPVLCGQLADMPPDGHQHMLCVEAARVDVPAVLPPGGTWQGWQRLSLG